MQKNILIAIQARSTSTRFPRKVFEEVEGKSILDHVIDSCKRSADYMNRFAYKTGIAVHLCLVIPKGDPIGPAWKHKIQIIEGSELDVLARYMVAVDQLNPDWIVRVTSDCPLLPSYVISKHIKLAVMNAFDYVSNIDPRYRTALDGADCEVVSAKLLRWANENTTEGREHVTPACREKPPEWAKIGAVIGFFDESDKKLSVDTKEDLEAVRENFRRVKKKVQDAERQYGRENVHRF